MADQPNTLVVLLAGNAGHGKSTLEEMLCDELRRWVSIRADAYAQGIKQVAHIALGIPWNILNAPKETKESSFVHIGGVPTDITVRQALLDIGDLFRDRFGERVWASGVRRRTALASERITIVTDARLPALEIHWMREHCEFAKRVFVARIRNSRVPINLGHSTESLIAKEPDGTFDFIVENEGSLEDLRAVAGELANAIVLLSKTGKKKLKCKGDGWGVFNDSGIQVCEPLLTEDEAMTAARRYDDTTATLQPMGPHVVRQMTYKHLKGMACA